VSLKQEELGPQTSAPSGASLRRTGHLTLSLSRDCSIFADRYVGWVRRYRRDAADMVEQIVRVLRPGGLVVLVVGNSYIRGWEVDNAQIFLDLLEDANVRISSVLTRDIPTTSRYLPPPSGDTSLSGRMRSEVVLAGRLLCLEA